MHTYNVNAIRTNAAHHVTHVLWYSLGDSEQCNCYPTEATTPDVINMLRNGCDVYLEIGNTVHHNSKFRIIAYPDGTEGIDVDGFALEDLPTFRLRCELDRS